MWPSCSDSLARLTHDADEADAHTHPKTPAAPKSKKGKKGGKGEQQPTVAEPTTDELKQVVAQLDGQVLPALAQLNEQAAKIAADEKAARVEAKLLEIKVVPESVTALAQAPQQEIPQDDQDELKRQEDATEVDIGKLQEKLGEIDELLAQGDLTPEQQKELENARANTESYLDKLRRLRDALLDKLANLAKYGRDKEALDAATEPVSEALTTVFDKYSTQAPQPFAVGKEDLEKPMIKKKSRLHETFPSHGPSSLPTNTHTSLRAQSRAHVLFASKRDATEHTGGTQLCGSTSRPAGRKFLDDHLMLSPAKPLCSLDEASEVIRGDAKRAKEENPESSEGCCP
ncbi:unnamed protein product, partial [Mesorhabditis belari]|uniref:Uncharacterized protein n=1 Tax=Mesorhabditis belari TaxID=2138241 RepID=A0AAF3EA93_9BILA